MRNIAFKEATKVIQAPPGRQDIEAIQVNVAGQVVTSCWKLTWRERWAALRHGLVWCRVISPGGGMPPIALDAMKTPFGEPK